jgi:hypothetical protein
MNNLLESNKNQINQNKKTKKTEKIKTKSKKEPLRAAL